MNYCQNLEKIKRVLLIGLGGVGTVFSNLISKNPSIDFRILVDELRLERYLKYPRKLNGVDCNFNYILSKDDFLPDLIIISTKSNAFDNVIDSVKKFVTPNTLFLSLSNGISSEYLLEQRFISDNIFHSFVICHTITRRESNIFHDGVADIVWGHKSNNLQKIQLLKTFFNETKIQNTLSDNIIKDMWEKFCFNCCVNQLSAIYNYTFTQIKEDEVCVNTIKSLSSEIQTLADKMGIKGLNLFKSSMHNLNKMLPDAKTSMLQDFEANREAEVDLFSKVVIKLAEKYNIDVSVNKEIYQKLILKYNVLCGLE